MKPPPLEIDKIDDINVIVRVVDRAGRQADDKWGIGRLRTVVPIEWAEKFTAQHRKFSDAVWARDVEATRKHGEAMIRAYAKLDEVAEAQGATHGPPTQWEFEGPDGLIVLVKDRARGGQVSTDGRKCAVWSLDEIASVIAHYPEISHAKENFPGAEVISVRPDPKMLDELYNEIPF